MKPKLFFNKILLMLMFFSFANAGLLNDLKTNLLCATIKFIPTSVILSSQEMINNKVRLPRKINEDMTLEKITLDKNKNAIIYNIKCDNYVDSMYIKVYLKNLSEAFKKMKAIQCIFNKGIKYKYLFYKIKNNKRQILSIKYFPY